MLQEKVNFEEAKRSALAHVKMNGPILPSQVASHIRIPLLFASALLSQLISEKAVRVSNLKVGGSPLYYVEGQETKLENFLNYLPSVEKDAVEKLKKEKILAEDNIRLVEKVALRNLKDFAVPLAIKIGERQKLFWKWYSLSQKDALEILEQFIRVYEKAEKVEDVQAVKEAAPSVEEKELGVTEKVEIKEDREEAKREVEGVEGVEEKRKDREKEKIKKARDFESHIKRYFEANKIKALEESIIKKDKEIEFILEVSSALGKINFFAIAKNKRNVSVTDITMAYHRGQEKRMPVIFLSPAKLNKKNEEKAKELGITFKALEL